MTTPIIMAGTHKVFKYVIISSSPRCFNANSRMPPLKGPIQVMLFQRKSVILIGGKEMHYPCSLFPMSFPGNRELNKWTSVSQSPVMEYSATLNPNSARSAKGRAIHSSHCWSPRPQGLMLMTPFIGQRLSTFPNHYSPLPFPSPS